MKGRTILLLIVITVVATGGIFAFQEQPTNMPPGVQKWIPLTENSGIALSDAITMFDLQGKPVAHGILMVKVHNSWREVYLDTAPHGIMPVKP